MKRFTLVFIGMKIRAVLQTEGMIESSVNMNELSAQYVNATYTEALEK